MVAALAAPGQVLNELTPAVLAPILRELKFEFQELPSGTFALTLDGRTVSLTVERTLRLAVALPGPARLEQVNAWNAEHRFGRAYIDDHAAAHLESDLPV